MIRREKQRDLCENYYSLFVKKPAMSDDSEEEVRRAADIREWLTKQVADKQEEIERLRTMLLIIDRLLKRSSFKTAASLGNVSTIPSKKFSESTSSNTNRNKVDLISEVTSRKFDELGETKPTNNPQEEGVERFSEIKQLRRIKDNLLLCTTSIFPSSVEITPAEGIMLSVNIQPFKSFFQNRILEGMRSRDMERVSKGEIPESDCLSYKIEMDDESQIKRILINNYRGRERLNEIFNTCTWVLTRMLEKKGG